MSDRYVKQWNVEGSTGNAYVVSLNKNGGYECSCPRWIYARKECSHIRLVKGATPAQQAPAATHGLTDPVAVPHPRPGARKATQVVQQPPSLSSVKGVRQIKLKRKS